MPSCIVILIWRLGNEEMLRRQCEAPRRQAHVAKISVTIEDVRVRNKDIIRNEHIRGNQQAALMDVKIKGCHLRWFWHVYIRRKTISAWRTLVLQETRKKEEIINSQKEVDQSDMLDWYVQ